MIFKPKSKLELNRPIIKFEMEPADWILEILAIVAILGFLGFSLYNIPRLPDTVPTHFDASGTPDGYGSKATLWMLPVIALVIYSIMTFISRIPEKLNYPVKITPANARKQYTLGLRLLKYLKLAIVLMFFFISYATVRTSLGISKGLGIWFLPVFIGVIVVPVIIYFILAMRYRK